MNEVMASVDFKFFGNAVRDRYNEIKANELYTTDAGKDEIWDAYLAAFPEGSNPIFRERTEHDCSCCKNFIRNIGSVIAVVDNEILTVWDIAPVGYPYDTVAKAMREYILSCNITGVYRTAEPQYGAEMTPELRDGKTLRWNHFSGTTSSAHKMRKEEIGPYKSEMESTHQVLSRGLSEITTDAINDVLELISAGALYRGDEHKASIDGFRDLQSQYINAGNHKELFIWQSLKNPAARFRNTVIGTLLTDLSTGVELEDAVKMFETKVAPENYKRPTALITPRMVDDALAKLDTLGLRESIKRRHAVISDLSVNDVLFVDNSVEPLMKDALRDSLLEETQRTPAKVSNATDISIADFVKDVLPKAKSIEALFDHDHVNKLVSLTAPASNGPPLFKWDNGLAWSYNGDLADSSLKQRVKRAGGNVDAALRVSLGWYNYDDLDIHCLTPDRKHIYFANKMGILDVDMNACFRRSREAVENLQWVNMPIDGIYQIQVHNYSKRESVDVGFELEFACGSDVRQFHYEKAVPGGKQVKCIDITVKHGAVTDVVLKNTDIKQSRSSQDVWSIKTGQLTPVDCIALSPNHWGAETGNKHTFFLLKGCKNPDPVRGIYNEFLKNDIAQHRKVLEVLASKTKAPYQNNQLSGLGFSSTQRASLTVVVKGDKTRSYNVNF